MHGAGRRHLLERGYVIVKTGGDSRLALTYERGEFGYHLLVYGSLRSGRKITHGAERHLIAFENGGGNVEVEILYILFQAKYKRGYLYCVVHEVSKLFTFGKFSN